MWLIYHIRKISYIFAFFLLINCGGGDSPVSISIPKETLVSFNTDVVSSSFISQLVTIAEDKKISIDETYDAFQWISNNPNFNPGDFKHVNIIIDGQTMSLEEGYYVLKGFKARYYDGKEDLWSMAVSKGQFDDELTEYLEIIQISEFDNGLTIKEKFDLYKQQGHNQKVIVKKTTSTESASESVANEPVIEKTVTQRTDSVTNDNGSVTTNVYDLTTTVTTITTITTLKKTPLTTYIWSDGTTTQSRGTTTQTSTSSDQITETVSETLSSTSTKHVIVSSDTVDSVEISSAVTERSEVIENDNGSITTNTYEVTTVTTTTTPITTHTWSNNTETQERGEILVTISSSELLISSDTTVVLVNTEQDSVVETSISVSEPKITETVSTREETISNADGSTTTNTYKTTVTTSTTTTTVTTTTTQRTTKTYSDGNIVVELGDPVITAESTEAVETTSNEVLITSVTTEPPTDYVTAEFEFSTGLAQINADAAYERGWTGAGVTVGLIDTGIDTEHTDFDQNKVTAIDFGYGTMDDHGHGTHVAGIMAASKNDEGVHGVAYDANIVSLKLCGSNGRCPGYYFDEAMLELSNNGVDIANLSANIHTQTYDEIVGAGIFYLEGQPSFDGVADDTLLNYKHAVDNGMIIVNSAGNKGRAYPDKPSHYATRVDENGDLYLNGQWLIVGAVGSTNEIVSWSNRAGHICSNLEYTDGIATGCNDEYRIRDFFVVAPGSGIYSTAVTGGNMPLSGTSQAAPYVTGSLAILKQAWPQLQPKQLVGLITSTAQDLGENGVDDIYGHGLVDLDAATQPQGDIIAVQPSGSISSVSGGIIGDSSLNALDDLSEISSIVVFDSFNRDYYIDDNYFSKFQLVEKPLVNQYANFEQQQLLSNNNIVFSMSENGEDWQYENHQNHEEKIDVTYRVGRINQESALFGSSFNGLFIIDSSTTNYFGADLSYKIKTEWNLFGSYTRGYSRINSSSNSFITGSSNIQSHAWYVGTSFERENDSFKIQLGEQLSVLGGSINYSIPTSYDWETNSTSFTKASEPLKSSNAPMVLEMFYNKKLNKNWDLSSGIRYTSLNNDEILSMNFNIKFIF